MADAISPARPGSRSKSAKNLSAVKCVAFIWSTPVPIHLSSCLLDRLEQTQRLSQLAGARGTRAPQKSAASSEDSGLSLQLQRSANHEWLTDVRSEERRVGKECRSHWS